MTKSKLISFFLFLLGFYLIISLSRNILTLVKKGEEIKKQNLKVSELKEKNKELKTRLEYVSSEEFIEKEAREKLGMAKPGEEILVLPENVLEKNKTKDKENEEELPNFKKWWRLFF